MKTGFGKRITEKLQSESGATLMMALLFFVLSTVCGSVILAAATVGSGRLARVKAEDHDHYAVLSAAELLKAEMDGRSVRVEETEKTIVYSHDETVTDEDGTEKTVTVYEERYHYEIKAPEIASESGTGLGVNTLQGLIQEAVKFSEKAEDGSGIVHEISHYAEHERFCRGQDEDGNALPGYDADSGEYDERQGTFSEPLFTGRAGNSRNPKDQIKSTFVMTVSGSSGDEDVDVIFLLDGTGNAVFHLRNHTARSGVPYQLQLTVPGVIDESYSDSGKKDIGEVDGGEVRDSEETITKSTRLSFGKGDVSRDFTCEEWTGKKDGTG